MTQKTKVPATDGAASAARPPVPAGWPGFGGLREEIERLFDAFEPRGWFDRSAGGAAAPTGLTMNVPAIDLSESNGGYRIEAELPGMDADNVELKVSNGVLTIRGEKTEESTDERKDMHVSERRWGSFQRVVRLPDDVDQDKIEASFDKGVLSVTMPKSAGALAAEKKIAIKAG